jgi:hypothetical protein
VGYAVGTQGLGDQCTPSRQLAAGTEYEGAFPGAFSWLEARFAGVPAVSTAAGSDGDP